MKRYFRPTGRFRSPAIEARHVLWSVISSADDLKPPPSYELIALLLDAAREALSIDLDDLALRSDPQDAIFVKTWPGEHYRLLAGLARVWQPKLIVEIGTFKGHSAAALSVGLPQRGRIVTYDLVPWTSISGAVLEGYESVVEQRLGNLADPVFRSSQLRTLQDADMIVVDGPKDGRFEPQVVRILSELSCRKRLVVFDDIRLLQMVRLWRDLQLLKLDATSLGHWSGTGLAFTPTSPNGHGS